MNSVFQDATVPGRYASSSPSGRLRTSFRRRLEHSSEDG